MFGEESVDDSHREEDPDASIVANGKKACHDDAMVTLVTARVDCTKKLEQNN
jgi:hypothetical protein